MSSIIEMIDISKHFIGIKANDHVNLELKKGEIHALLGENGAGKSTLMSVLFGLYQADGGTIKVRGEEVQISNPKIAYDLGIGMVHQHFKLVQKFDAVRNIVLGNEPKKFGVFVDIKTASERVKQLSEKYKFKIDFNKKVEEMSVGEQQKIEILKMLYRDAEILIFDEPTAVLTPQEIDELLISMKALIKEGKSIILITHKLKEIMSVADRCTVLRRGKSIDTVNVSETNEKKLAELMVGRSVSFDVDKKEAEPKEVVLDVNNLCAKNTKGIDFLNDVSFNLRSGEILGLAGVEGNGQNEIVKSITGLSDITSGTISICGTDATNSSIRERYELGIGHIPEDRHKHGLVLDYNLEENFILQSYYKAPFSKNYLLNEKTKEEFTSNLIDKFDVRSAKGSKSMSRSLSGGNQQKAIIAREFAMDPKVLIAVQPTRGLDIGAIEYIHEQLIEERDKGCGVLLVSFELDEILNVSDRILVVYNGEIVKEVMTKDITKEEIGLYMAGGVKHD